MPLPHFLIIGVPKAATTSLHRYLRQHPDVCMARKEPHFFVHFGADKAYRGPGDDASTANDVTQQPAYEALFETCGTEQKRGDVSPQYLADKRVPDRVRKTIPHARFVAILRDPVGRCYSNFMHLRREGREPLRSFEQALQQESARLEAGWEPFWGYREQSRYGSHLQPWLRTFGRDRFHVTTMEAMQAEPVATVQEIYRFIGVDPAFVPDVTVRHNAGGLGRAPRLRRRLGGARPLGGVTRFLLPRPARRGLHRWLHRKPTKYPAMEESTRRRLQQEFLPEVEQVERDFDLDLGAWKPHQD